MLNALTAVDCDFAQGHLFGMPLYLIGEKLWSSGTRLSPSSQKAWRTLTLLEAGTTNLPSTEIGLLDQSEPWDLPKGYFGDPKPFGYVDKVETGMIAGTSEAIAFADGAPIMVRDPGTGVLDEGQVRSVRVRPGEREEPLRRFVPILRRHLHHGHTERVERGRSCGAGASGDDRREVGRTRLVRALEALEVEGERSIEGRAAQEERPRHSERLQDGRRDRRVACEVVVEGDRGRKPLTAPAASHRVEQPFGRDDVVVPGDVSNLPLEEPRFVRRDELTRRIARTPIHTVVHERNAGPAPREPEDEHEAERDGRADEAGQRSRHALRE
jgi:hypothetical protein